MVAVDGRMVKVVMEVRGIVIIKGIGGQQSR